MASRSFLVTFLLATCCLSRAEGQVRCPGNDKRAELSFVKPVGWESLSIYPLRYLHVYGTRPLSLDCCSTGFSKIQWERDGVALGPSTLDTHQYDDDKEREKLLVYSLQFNSPPRPNGFYETVYTCTAFSTDLSSRISNNFTLFGLDAPPQTSFPEFTKAEAHKNCYNVGDRIRIACTLQFPYRLVRSLDLWYILMNYSDGTSIPSEEVSYRRFKRNDKVYLVVVIARADNRWLDREYTCRYDTSEDVSSSFRINSCNN